MEIPDMSIDVFRLLPKAARKDSFIMLLLMARDLLPLLFRFLTFNELESLYECCRLLIRQFKTEQIPLQNLYPNYIVYKLHTLMEMMRQKAARSFVVIELKAISTNPIPTLRHFCKLAFLHATYTPDVYPALQNSASYLKTVVTHCIPRYYLLKLNSRSILYVAIFIDVENLWDRKEMVYHFQYLMQYLEFIMVKDNGVRLPMYFKRDLWVDYRIDDRQCICLDGTVGSFASVLLVEDDDGCILIN
jgi:hypothetical protein